MPGDFAKGESLESVLRPLSPDGGINCGIRGTVTSILLLDGTTLHHGAGPKLPPAYRNAIDNQMSNLAGSSRTAAFFGHPIYVSDIANDPLWANYSALALDHDFRACWSTPIRNSEDKLLGTFAVYHKRPRSPTDEELQSIATITEHVARAIMFYRDAQGELGRPSTTSEIRPPLRLVSEL